MTKSPSDPFLRQCLANQASHVNPADLVHPCLRLFLVFPVIRTHYKFIANTKYYFVSPKNVFNHFRPKLYEQNGWKHDDANWSQLVRRVVYILKRNDDMQLSQTQDNEHQYLDYIWSIAVIHVSVKHTSSKMDGNMMTQIEINGYGRVKSSSVPLKCH